MRRFYTRIGGLAAMAMLAAMMATPAQAAPAPRACAMPVTAQTDSVEAHSPSRAEAAPVYFKMTTLGSSEPFVIQLTDTAKIEHARRIISGKETATTHVMGRIIKRKAPYNPAYSFHLDPNTIDFFHMAIEVCDATLSYTEDHLDEACGAFLPGCFFCPWTSKLVAEVPQP
ncbi:BP74-related protein [Streptosporangium subroseum]|uniref:BP74-related protein n=1 Tax=Streptosporangium subroseum TaxID=106412 RepID=UPI0030906082|nr:calmodulin-binding protein [Streptosporangium subroseum]